MCAAASRHVLVTVTHASSLQLWLVDLSRAAARRLTDRPLNGTMDLPAWVDDITVTLFEPKQQR